MFKMSISSKTLLLSGASLLAITLANPANAGLTFGGATGGRSAASFTNSVAHTTTTTTSSTTSTTVSESNASFSTALSVIQAKLASQAAARAAAQGVTSTVPDGLTAGGLNPVANPVSTAAADTTGVLTWEGASTPTQTITDGKTNVTIQQTQSRAILSWQSFNVGKNTTLTFDQKGNADWIALNRVVGSTAPSQILGQIKADGTVLIINQNGILFSATAQVNTHSLIASTLEVASGATIAGRNSSFLTNGILSTNSGGGYSSSFSSFGTTGQIEVDAGAEITSGDSGYILLAGSTVTNSGTLTATNGQVILAAGSYVTLIEATGKSDSLDPGLRGFLPIVGGQSSQSVVNTADGIIQSTRGSIILNSSGVADIGGVLYSTTSVSRNGAIEISGSTIDITPGSLITILPDGNGETIPQDSTSLADFKSSQILIGNLNNRASGSVFASDINIESDTLIYAPSGDITIGASAGATATSASTSDASRIFVSDGAVIDASGLLNVAVTTDQQTITITPVKKNELADSPLYRDGFLNGATITIDPTLSGVRDDGVAWIGSPLIDAKSYYEQIGASVEQLMTTGGNVTLGSGYFNNTSTTYESGHTVTTIYPVSQTPYVVVASGAVINISGGSLYYEPGTVTTTKLISSDGRIVDIGSADVNATYLAVYNGYNNVHSHWDVSENYSSSYILSATPIGGYSEGRDAGTLTFVAPTLVMEGTLLADTVNGERQKSDAVVGTATSSVYGDARTLQAASSQLASGGGLIILATASGSTDYPDILKYDYEGADIAIVAAKDYTPVSDSLSFGQTVTINADGTTGVSARTSSSYLAAAQIGTIKLSDALLSNSGLSEVVLHTTGSVSVAKAAEVSLNPGGVFNVLSGHGITIDGSVSVPSGQIALETYDSQLVPKLGYSTATYGVGSFDITVNGTLSVRGLWVNDYGLVGDEMQGEAWLDGGEISLYAAPRVLLDTSDTPYMTTGSAAQQTATDISGSIRIKSGALLDLSSGGYVDSYGNFVLTAKGGDLGLYNETTYFQLLDPTTSAVSMNGIRTGGLLYNDGLYGSASYMPVNPAEMTSGVFIDSAATIKANGFGGGGTFTLVTPEFQFGDGTSTTATELPLDFFSNAGFANYKITSYKTKFVDNTFQYQGLLDVKTYYASAKYIEDTNYGYFYTYSYSAAAGKYYYDDYYAGRVYFDLADLPAGTAYTDVHGNVLTYDPTYNSGSGGFYSYTQVAGTVTPGGTDTFLATQTLTVGAGQTLNLSQSLLPSVLDQTQAAKLLSLKSGGDIYSVLTPSVPDNAWDAKAVNLTLGGLLELHVAKGGTVTGAAEASLTVSKLLNEGTIYLPGGDLIQQEILPALYVARTVTVSGVAKTGAVLGIRDLSDIFSVSDDGTIVAESTSEYSSSMTNGQLAGSGSATNLYPIYFLGLLDADQGIVLASGSVTDLSGTSIRNPYSVDKLTGETGITGRIVAGGNLVASASKSISSYNLFRQQRGSAYNVSSSYLMAITPTQVGNSLTADAGAVINLSGASDTYKVTATKSSLTDDYLATSAVWSDAGTLTAGAGFTLTGATITAFGGSDKAEDGTITLLDPVLVQSDPATPAANVISADQINKSGFETLVAVGSLSSLGDVDLSLGRALFVTSRNYVLDGATTYAKTLNSPGDAQLPTLKSGGALVINAPYIGLTSSMDLITNPAHGTAGTGSVTLNATTIDITGAVLFDKSVASATLNASGDVRLIGAQPWQTTYGKGTTTAVTTLNGALASNGDLTINAARIYPTTGSNFSITSAAADGTITFGRTGTGTPDAPYSAGASLTVAAAHIVQGGVLDVPLGTLTLGKTSAYKGIVGASDDTFHQGSYTLAAATQDLTLVDGGITSVSADGLSIPYGTTTDGIEWYFSPTSSSALTSAPGKTLVLNGVNVAVDSGATVDLTGGGDVYAYEFVPGTGGSRDVLDRYNSDTYTGNDGYQYSDGRQVYAIVPGLSDAQAAALDPIYSSGYSNLYSTSGVGKRVYLSGGDGLAAGWYTLLPAKYALLPGGMEVVEQTGSSNVVLGTSVKLSDGSLQVSGYYGDALSGASSSSTHLFSVVPQATIKSESNITITTGNSYFATLASDNGLVASQLPIDAARLQINASTSLAINSVLSTAAASGGRGAQVDIGGSEIAVIATSDQAVAGDGTLYVTAGSLSNLNAASLLVGGTRTDNTDGTTTLNVTASSVRVSNTEATPLSAGEIILVGTGSVKVDDGSAITATDSLTDTRDGAYVIGSTTKSGTGALLRVANGSQRAVERTNATSAAALQVGSALLKGSAILFDSSGSDTISASLKLSGEKSVAISAPQIGIGVDPATYSGTVASAALAALLGKDGATLILRSQSSIDIAGGDYSFGNITLDAQTLSSTDGGSVTINADTVTLGNSTGYSGVCNSCVAGDGSLAFNANEILFSGGRIETKASYITSDTQVTLPVDTTFTIPAGTRVYDVTYGYERTLDYAVTVTLPANTLVTVSGGTGVVLPTSADGTLSAGTEVTFGAGTLKIGENTYSTPNGIKLTSSYTAPTTSINLLFQTTTTIPDSVTTTLTAATPVTETDFFAGGVTLNAKTGIFSQGANGLLDAGHGALTLHTPYLGDNVAGSTSTSTPSLTLATSGALTVDNTGTGTTAAVTGTPGGSLTLRGNTVSISGTVVAATAGTLNVIADNGITIANGAVIKTPGYSKTYGDSADPVTEDAPGGTLILQTAQGDIDIGTGTTVSVGGTAGLGGTLELVASNGSVDIKGTIDGAAPDGASSLVVDTAGGFDLAMLGAAANNLGFTGDVSIHTRAGDLTLAKGQSLTATSLSLTDDGGSISVAGTIDTSGDKGGDVSLYGANGVSLASTAVIDTHADGYGKDDSRQSEAGDVTLGTAGSGAISIAQGAKIDLSATNPDDRLVAFYNNGVKYYEFVDGDLGGKLVLRAPVVEQSGSDTVNVSVASAASVVGAREIDLVGVKSWDLRTLGAIANSGVTIDTASNTAVLDPRGDYLSNAATADGIVPFIQNFDISGSYANLGGLASSSVFHAKPGVDLVFDGNIEMDRNWNLAAGTVDVAGAKAAGLMGSETYTGVNGVSVTTYYVVPGKDTALFNSPYISMLYRTGGTVTGEAPVLSIEATGDLLLNASISDGFFQFRNQTDANYLWAAVASGGKIVVNVPTGYDSSSSGQGATLSTVSAGTIVLASANNTATSILYVPYSADGNSASPEKAGDPFGSAELFPALTNGYADSASLNLVAGSDISRDTTGLQASVNPVAINPNADSMLSIGGSYTYSYGGSAVQVRYGTTFNRTDTTTYTSSNYASQTATSDDWLNAVITAGSTISSSYAGTTETYGTNQSKAVLISSSAAAKKLDSASDLIYMNISLTKGSTVGSAKSSADFNATTLRDIAKISDPTDPKYDAYLHSLYVSNASSANASGDFFTIAASASGVDPYTSTAASSLRVVVSLKTAAYILKKYIDPLFPAVNQTTAVVNSVVRSGVGSINLASGGSVDLTGGERTMLKTNTGFFNYSTVVNTSSGLVAGGATVYTAGHVADTSIRTAVDPETGVMITIDPTALLRTGTNFGSKATYGYGNLVRGASMTSGVPGVLISDDVYAEGGGDVTISAQDDVYSLRDQSLGGVINATGNTGGMVAGGYNVPLWIGGTDETWRAGAVGSNTWAQIDPQVFHGGVGALGGGDVTVKAGGDIVDLTAVATDSLTTANATSGTSATKALMTFGRGDVTLIAGGSILGASVDVASGSGLIKAGGSVAKEGADATHIHLTDATINILANGSVTLNGISGLGATDTGAVSATTQQANNLNASSFYTSNASISVVADGSVYLGNDYSALLPGSLSLVSITDDLIFANSTGSSSTTYLMIPSATGELQLLAGGSILSDYVGTTAYPYLPVEVAMLDADPGVLPGLYTNYDGTGNSTTLTRLAVAFPFVDDTVSNQTRALQHKAVATHINDTVPVRIYAGEDIGSSTSGLTLSVPKQARITAGRDIVDMMFYGQNLLSTDITRIVAGRDIIGTTQLLKSASGSLPTVIGNSFVIGGPGEFMIEAGRNLGPFMPSVTIIQSVAGSNSTEETTYSGGIVSVGNEWNPYLSSDGAEISVLFGVGGGVNYDGFRNAYLDPANLATMPDYLFEQVTINESSGVASVSGTVADRTKPIYGPKLIAWMQEHRADALKTAYGTTNVTYEQAYAIFKSLPEISQRAFINQVYFSELSAADNPDGASYLQYARGYTAVNTLFPADWGYTKNDLTGGSNGANSTVQTGNLDLRLATIETARGGDISILGPGGRVLAGSTVRTAAQAARRNYLLNSTTTGTYSILSIPTGYEGVLTLRGGDISTFTDGDFLLNQSRLFTEEGGDIIMWSSNGDINAGQGPKTSSNFPPVLYRVSPDGYFELDQTGATTGAGIATLQTSPDDKPSDVHLLAPRGTVDAGDAGVRVSGNLYLAAKNIANADNFLVQGKSFGLPPQPVTNLNFTIASQAATDAATITSTLAKQTPHTEIDVEVTGFGGDYKEPEICVPSDSNSCTKRH